MNTVAVGEGPRHPVIVETVRCPDEQATAALAQALASRPGLRQALITLQGDLGAGKTTLVRHLLRALGIQGRIRSPTYALVEPYDPPGLPIWHFDFYRFTNPDEWEDAGLRELFARPGLKLVEWPQQAGPRLPRPDLACVLHVATDGSRQIELSALSPLGRTLLPEAGRTGQ
ncbi:MAG: tRNA (adenosine(37)-N6)-threonylcarbamoyltransferase complex ATPase subunit type 1 TsaE [Rhodoferax sp.]|nr:tRNA (adenosine(37)-N6)-threonylcarbamoyltransferase complex ATPase subunit type 1 TsaE [Rhodoferax sp.]